MEINLSLLLDIFIRRIWIIILVAAIAAGGAFAYCELLATPRYKATASILVTNGALTEQDEFGTKTSVSSTDITASLDLIDTVIDILKTSEVYRETAKASEDKYTFKELLNTATVARRSGDTLFIDISFVRDDGLIAVDIVNLFAETSCEYIAKIIPNSNATVVAKSTNAALIYPRPVFSAFLSGGIAAIVIFVICLLLESNNTTIKSEEDFSKQFDIPIIGSVPDFDNHDISAYALEKKGK